MLSFVYNIYVLDILYVGLHVYTLFLRLTDELGLGERPLANMEGTREAADGSVSPQLEGLEQGGLTLFSKIAPQIKSKSQGYCER